jgi:hypothetical protein
MENLESQADTVRTARSFAGEKWIAVTPVTLKPRFNPFGAGAAARDRLPPFVDERQMSMFGAAWTLGSIKYLAEAGANSITYYDCAGWTGVMERADGSSMPRLFRSLSGGVFPLYHVFADVADMSSGEAVQVQSSDPLKLCAVLLRRADRGRLMIANLTPAPVEAAWSAWIGKAARMRTFSASQYDRAATAPEKWREESWTPLKKSVSVLELPAYSVTSIDTTLR